MKIWKKKKKKKKIKKNKKNNAFFEKKGENSWRCRKKFVPLHPQFRNQACACSSVGRAPDS